MKQPREQRPPLEGLLNDSWDYAVGMSACVDYLSKGYYLTHLLVLIASEKLLMDSDVLLLPSRVPLEKQMPEDPEPRIYSLLTLTDRAT